MGKIEFNKVLREVKALSSEEQQQLRQLLDTLVPNHPSSVVEDEFEQRLLKLGLLDQVKPPITDFTPYQNRKPIEVKGKPVSEVIIEERR